MKNLILIGLLFVPAILWHSCSKDRLDLEYPVRFSLHEIIDTFPIFYHYLREDENKFIRDTVQAPTFASFPDSVAAWLAPDRFQVPFDSIILLDDFSARIYYKRKSQLSDTTVSCIRGGGNNSHYTTFTAYYKTDTSQESLFFEVLRNSEGDRLVVSAYIYQYSHKRTFPPTESYHSPIEKIYRINFIQPADYIDQTTLYRPEIDTLALKYVNIRYR
ncbi:MAG: hypothetical protein JNL02_07235 [Saprospiraceae bacterium]|nr:hypothetical protein [Saprospiraceae bacterium]